jgi:hypothetical protein
MSDERLIGALRALDRPVDVDAGFGEALYAILEGEYARRRQFGPRLAWLLVAALLTALLVGGAVAVGSGLVRLPWLTDRSLIPTAGCPADLLAPPAETRVTEITAEGATDPPGPVAFAACSFWVGSRTTNVVQRIDPSTNEITAAVRVGPSGSRIVDLASEGDDLWASIWVSFGEWRLVRIDTARALAAEEIDIPDTIGDHMVVTGGRAWLSGFEFPRPGVIDLTKGEVVTTFDPPLGQFASGFGAVWATGNGIARIDPKTFQVTRFSLPGGAVSPEASATGIWTAAAGRIYKLSPSGEILLTVDSALELCCPLAVGDSVYVFTLRDLGEAGTEISGILRVDELTGEILERLDYRWEGLIGAVGGSLWFVGGGDAPTLVRYEVPNNP